MADIVFGWRKDKYDARDYLHRTVKLDQIPASHTIPALPPVRQQAPQSSCVGFGIGAMLTANVLAVDIKAEWFSPQWIYNGARFIEGTLNQDIGAFPKDALDWIVQNGALLEHFWPYPSQFDPRAPSSTQMAQSNKYPDFAYYRVVDGVAGICSAIAAGHCVAIGSPWFSLWYSPDATGKLAEVTAADATVGGHETNLIGYDQVGKVFLGMNSWGSGWGNKGFFIMPFSALDVFKQLWGYDAHYVTFTAPPPQPVPIPPEPVPVPTPSPCKWGKAVAATANIIFLQKLRKRKGRFAYIDP